MNPTTAHQLILDTCNAYDAIAEDFHTTRAKFWAEQEYSCENLRDDERVLDLGCGNARLLRSFRESKARYVGVDGSARLLMLAHEAWKDRQPEPEFAVWTPLNGALPFPDASFDRVSTLAFLHHLPSREIRRQTLTECQRVLKPKGHLYISCWRIWNRKYADLLVKYTLKKLLGQSSYDWFDVAMPYTQTNRERKVLRYYHAYRKGELRRDVEAAGFTIVRDRSNGRNYFFEAVLSS